MLQTCNLMGLRWVGDTSCPFTPTMRALSVSMGRSPWVGPSSFVPSGSYSSRAEGWEKGQRDRGGRGCPMTRVFPVIGSKCLCFLSHLCGSPSARVASVGAVEPEVSICWGAWSSDQLSHPLPSLPRVPCL